MNTQHEISQKQYQDKSNDYLNSMVHRQGIEFDKIIQRIKSLPQAPRILDLGCGGGHVSYAVAPFAQEVVAYDLSTDMLEVVQQTAVQQQFHHIHTQQGAAEQLAFEDQQFDMVITRFSAHHWHHVGQAMQEIYRVLKPSGQVIIIDTISTGRVVLDTFIQTMEMIRDLSHVRNYTVAEWVQFAEQAKLNPIQIEKQKLALDFSSWVARMRTPLMAVETIRYLQQGVSSEIASYYAIQEDGSFTNDVMYMVLNKA